MEKVLLYFALSLCIVATLLYLWRAFDFSPVWGWVSILIPPTALIFYVIHREKSKKLACFHIVAFSVMLLSTIMAVRSHPLAFSGPFLSNLRVTFAPASYGQPLLLDEQRFPSKEDLADFNRKVENKFGGEFMGEMIVVDDVTLKNDVLRLTKGKGFFAEKQVSIVLGDSDSLSQVISDSADRKARGKKYHLSVSPEDNSVPSIYLQSKKAGDEFPNIDIVASGYWLDLTLEFGIDNTLSGHMRLLLPGEKNNFLTGYFNGYTNDLRYEEGEVDRTVHSNETVEYVVSSYLQKRLGYQLAEITGFENTFFDLNGANPEGAVDVTFALMNGDVREEHVALLYSNDGWSVIDASTDELLSALREMKQDAPASGPTKKPESIVLVANDADQLFGKEVVVLLRSKKERMGVLQEITPFSLVLRNQVGAGHVDIVVSKREVVSVSSVVVL